MKPELTAEQARRGLAAAYEQGMIALCQRCGQPATLMLSCETGEFQGTGCDRCWQAHRDMIETAFIFGASGVQVEPFCSRCGVEGPGAEHVVAERIEPV